MITKEEDCCLKLVVRGKREFGFDEEDFEKLEIGVGAYKPFCKGVLRVKKKVRVHVCRVFASARA